MCYGVGGADQLQERARLHVADYFLYRQERRFEYEFCSAAEGKQIDKGIEKTAKTKAEIVAAVKDAFAYCDASFAKMTDASAVETVTFFGQKLARIGIMDFNTAHTMEHYGNLVTYMRLKGIVPPSSEGQK